MNIKVLDIAYSTIVFIIPPTEFIVCMYVNTYMYTKLFFQHFSFLLLLYTPVASLMKIEKFFMYEKKWWKI